MTRVDSRLRPTPGISVTADTARGENHLICRQIRLSVRSSGRPLGECWISVSMNRQPKTPWRMLKDGVHGLQEVLANAYGEPSAGMLSDLRLEGRQVIFIHNPKAGGTSLGRLLGVKRRSHAFPSHRINTRNWHACFSIVAVRDPFDRFISGYFDHVRKPNSNALTRIYGEAFKNITPFEYLDILLENPKFGGPQRKNRTQIWFCALKTLKTGKERLLTQV